MGIGGLEGFVVNIDASIELRRFRTKIGVVGKDVVDDSDEVTDPPCEDELFLKQNKKCLR